MEDQDTPHVTLLLHVDGNHQIQTQTGYAGYVLMDDSTQQIIVQQGKVLKKCRSSVEAEYRALRWALGGISIRERVGHTIVIVMDNKSIIESLTYRSIAKDRPWRQAFYDVINILEQYQRNYQIHWQLQWVPRGENKHADSEARKVARN